MSRVLRRCASILVVSLAWVSPAFADDPPPAPAPVRDPVPAPVPVPAPAPAPAVATAPVDLATSPTRIVDVRVRGKSKVTPSTIAWLAHFNIGDRITFDQVPQFEAALVSSELFEDVKVTLEGVPDGVLVVATVHDKMSWIAAPTLYLLPSNWAVGVGYAENNLLGETKKLLLYGQVGNRTSLFFGTYLDPAVNGWDLQLRFDIYLFHKILSEYANATPRDVSIARTTEQNFLDAGALLGWRFYWWLNADARARAAYAYFRHPRDDQGNMAPSPEVDGYDVTMQLRTTLDARSHRYGVTWGPYVQAMAEASVPGLDSYGFIYGQLRAYYSWRLFDEHELELRHQLQVGRHLPFNEEFTLGGVSDLRGYNIDQFRGDTRATFRVEYSVPLVKWRFFAFRAIGFWDSGYIGFHFRDPSGKRDYLASQGDGAHYYRNDVGAGLRIYVSSIVLPLLGLDFGYGIEGHSPEVYFEVGLTDF